jgi:hypothetical protein
MISEKLTVDEDKRPNAKEMLEHKWLQHALAD